MTQYIAKKGDMQLHWVPAQANQYGGLISFLQTPQSNVHSKSKR